MIANPASTIRRSVYASQGLLGGGRFLNDMTPTVVSAFATSSGYPKNEQIVLDLLEICH